VALDLADYDSKAREAVSAFWAGRDEARHRQRASGRSDQGERSEVTSGKNMSGFLSLFIDLVRANGLADADIHQKRAVVTLPGYFRPTKLWDLLVMCRGQLVAAIEFKSQVGPSFGNNFNNRAEEAIGTAHDFWTAYREGAFGKRARPFVGWLMFVEDAPASRRAVRDTSPHFPVFNAFRGASYIERYDLLCQRLMHERLYDVAALMTSARAHNRSGAYASQSDLTSLQTFVTRLAGHVAAEAARIP